MAPPTSQQHTSLAESGAVVAGNSEPLLGRICRTVESDRARARDAERISFGVRDSDGTPTKDSSSTASASRSKAPATIRTMPASARPSRSSAVVPPRRPERHGLQRRPHLAQHADARVGRGLRPHGHDDDVRDAPDELQSRGHGATGNDDQALSQLAFDHSVVDGQRRVDDDAATAGRPRDRRHDRAHATNSIPRACARPRSTRLSKRTFPSSST